MEQGVRGRRRIGCEGGRQGGGVGRRVGGKDAGGYFREWNRTEQNGTTFYGASLPIFTFGRPRMIDYLFAWLLRSFYGDSLEN